jgi:hypothetical protein
MASDLLIIYQYHLQMRKSKKINEKVLNNLQQYLCNDTEVPVQISTNSNQNLGGNKNFTNKFMYK